MILMFLSIQGLVYLLTNLVDLIQIVSDRVRDHQSLHLFTFNE